MKKNFKLLMLTLIMGGGLFASEAMALEQKDGIYQIGTAQDWADFCKLNNETNTFWKGKAVMTADVTVDGNIMVGINGDKHPFEGVFDGQGHTLTINYDIEEDRVAPFRRINGATIKNLRVDGTITVKNGKQFAAGIVGGIWGSHGDSRILNCISNVTIKDDATHDGTHGGIVGYCQEDSYTLIENCAFTGAFEAENVEGCGGIIGWARNNMFIKDCYVSASIIVQKGDIIDRNSANVYNCFYVDKGNMDNGKGATQVSSNDLASGKFCFELNDRQHDNFVVWRQKLGTDGDQFPTPFGTSIVYPYSDQGVQCNGNGKNNSNISFTNTKSNNIDTHNYSDWGFCSTCDHQQPDFMIPVDGYYEIANNKQLNWFAVKVNQRNLFINAKLTADITDYGNGPMIGVDNDYSGIFDGQNHTITIGFTHNYGNVGLFRNIRKATIKNLKIDGSITNESYQIGGLVSISRGNSKIQNVVIGVNITSNFKGQNDGYVDGTHGGVIAVAYGVPTIENVAFVGSINAQKCYGTCGFIGYAHDGGSIEYKNCYVTGTLDVVKEGDYNSRVFGRHDEKCSNCYTSLDMKKTSDDDNKFKSDDNNGTVNSNDVERGKLCYLLNGSSSDNPAWYQTIGTDNYPVPFTPGHKVVYNNSFNNADLYANIRCDSQDGYFEIANADDLKDFSVLVNVGNPDINAKLIADIDFGSENTTSFTPIGTGDHKYGGTFDGQTHKILNMVINAGVKEQGLFGVCHAGVHIKNLTIDNSCKLINAGSNKCISALIGCVNANNNEDGVVTIENVGNEMNLEVGTGSGATDCGSLLGHDYSANLIVKIINCYNTGNVTGWESAALTGWTPRVAVINSWNTGRVKSYQNYNYGNSNSLVRGNGNVVVTNSYDLNIYNDTNEDITNVDNNQSCNWRPNRDTNNGYPSADYSSEWLSNGKLFASLFAYTNNDDNVNGSAWRMGTDYPVLYGNAIAMHEDCQNKMVAGTYDVKLYRTIKAGVWNTFCAPFAMPKSQFEKVVELDTNNSDTDVLHFVNVTGDMVAGKSYLVKISGSDDLTEINKSNAEVLSSDPSASTAGGYAFTGVYRPTNLVENDYVMTTSNLIKKVPQGGAEMKGFRAYLRAVPISSARATSFVIDEDGTTGIITATGEVIENGKVYNLGGQRVKESQRGLYIVNGKKYIK